MAFGVCWWTCKKLRHLYCKHFMKWGLQKRQSWEQGGWSHSLVTTTPVPQKSSFSWEKHMLLLKPLYFSQCFSTILCAQRSLFSLLCAFSSLNIFPVVSSHHWIYSASSITPTIRARAFKNPGLSSFQAANPPLAHPAGYTEEQHHFDAVPLAAIRIKSAPGCL